LVQIDDLNEQPQGDATDQTDMEDGPATVEDGPVEVIFDEAAEEAEKSDENDGGETVDVDESGEENEPGGEDGDVKDGVKDIKQKTSFFKKHDKRDEKIDELEDRLRRLMAEFENFRKRTEKEKSSMYDYGAKSTLEKILPVVDSFERGIAAIKDDEKELPAVQGFEKIYKLLIDALEKAGATAMDAAGKPFDPEYHSAVMHTEEEGAGENLVAEELQKGYMYRDSVLRHAMVRVVN
jgi:molecular chaperone GrpE